MVVLVAGGMRGAPVVVYFCTTRFRTIFGLFISFFMNVCIFHFILEHLDSGGLIIYLSIFFCLLQQAASVPYRSMWREKKEKEKK
jgi:hypothetical protein